MGTVMISPCHCEPSRLVGTRSRILTLNMIILEKILSFYCRDGSCARPLDYCPRPIDAHGKERSDVAIHAESTKSVKMDRHVPTGRDSR